MKFRKLHIPGVISLLLILAVVSTDLVAKNKHTRDGWVIGLSLGPGWASFNNINGESSGTSGGGVGALRFGKVFGSNLLFSAEFDAWVRSETENNIKAEISLFSSALALTYFPGNPETGSGGIYLRGGIGLASTNADLSSGNVNVGYTERGWGFLLGAGYEFRLGKKFALGVGTGFNKLLINGDNFFDNAQFIPLFLDLNWYL